MAKKPPVKCFYCGEKFYREVEQFVQVSARRYAHKLCYDRYQADLIKEERDKQALEQYIKKIFKLSELTEKIKAQLKDYINNKKYSYAGILNTLTYVYDVKNNSIEKSNNGIGIVPYCYDESQNYYYNLWLAQQQNLDKPIKQYKPEIIEIQIPPPKRQEMTKNQFTFFDEDDD